ncbi:DUF6223 family protein [Nonomuraea dietziae]|uniref:Uncharacterized protein n=1 Tax=Nonomuraea dietziae TaxID=65515 RepID=A0A7W5V0N9_9ACTN|nr:DUF6223 family protein [Nonomuraea dietziae]MBB3726569.1 hypothetical protein [Nonomuraea dietziae]
MQLSVAAAGYDIGSGRTVPPVAVVLGLISVVIGGLARARSVGIGVGNRRAGAVTALALGLTSLITGGPHAAGSAGGSGTGRGHLRPAVPADRHGPGRAGPVPSPPHRLTRPRRGFTHDLDSSDEAHGLRSRILFSAHALEDPAQEPHARSQHALGDLHRVTTERVRHLAIVNRAVAFVQADPGNPKAGALQIRRPAVVAVLADVFDGMGERARDLDDLPLSPIERRVLRAVASLFPT